MCGCVDAMCVDVCPPTTAITKWIELKTSNFVIGPCSDSGYVAITVGNCWLRGL